MVARNPQPRKPVESAVEMAIAAMEDSPNPMDMEMGGIDPSPTALDFDDGEESEMCSNPRRSRPAADARAGRGSPLCDDCACHGLPGTMTDESSEAHAGVADDHAEGVA